MSIIGYLLDNSSVVKELKDSIEEGVFRDLLNPYDSKNIDYNANLIRRIPEFSKEKISFEIALSSGKYVYSSLKGLSSLDLENLCKLIDYLYLPAELLKKLRSVIEFNAIDEKRWIRLYKESQAAGSRITQKELLVHAAIRGYLDCMKWLHEAGARWSIDVSHCAASYGNLECLKYAHMHGCPWTSDVLFDTINEGHLDCVKYLYKNNCPHDDLNIIDRATSNLDCMKYFYSEGFIPTELAFKNAASGNLDVLKWLNEIGCPRGSTTCAEAQDYLECLQWMHENGFPWGEIPTRCTLVNIDCLKYAIDNGCPYDKDIINRAMSFAFIDLSVLEYLRSVGCEWDETTCLRAATNGKVDCLEYAVKNGCPWNKEECLNAAKKCANITRYKKFAGIKRDETIAWILSQIGADIS